MKKRGDSYDEVKNSIGHQMIEQTCQLYPQIRDCIDFTEIGSPVTNKHYIAQPHGEIYGLDHSIENRLVMCGLICEPSPRMNRPSL